MSSCERPSKSSGSDLVPSSVSKLYSFSTGTQGRSRRFFVSSSLRRVISFSSASSLSRSACHSSWVPTACSVIAQPPYLTGVHTLEIGCGPITHRASEHPASPVIPPRCRGTGGGQSLGLGVERPQSLQLPGSDLAPIEQRAVHLHPARAPPADEPGADDHDIPVSLD